MGMNESSPRRVYALGGSHLPSHSFWNTRYSGSHGVNVANMNRIYGPIGAKVGQWLLGSKYSVSYSQHATDGRQFASTFTGLGVRGSHVYTLIAGAVMTKVLRLVYCSGAGRTGPDRFETTSSRHAPLPTKLHQDIN